MVSLLNNDKIKKGLKKAGCLVVAGAMVISLTGCMEREISTNANASYDIIDTTSNEALENGITQILDIPGEDFKLVVNYQCELQEGEKWTITSDKQIDIEARTDGLPSDISVYIDNVHIDTTICSYYPQVDGITQDSMDDRIHNSVLMGFELSDAITYYGINQIEGQNQTFIQGSIHGFSGYTNGSISERRFLESDYLEKGVYANKMSSIFDLIIVYPDGRTRCVSVPSEIQISVWPFIQRQKDDGSCVYRYYYQKENGNMTYDDLSEQEYLIKTEIDNQKAK